MKNYILEACVDSVESALAAEKGGATRLELCSNLIIGGTTPSPCLFQEIREHSDICTHILIRPRFGDFCYTDYEFRVIRREVRNFRELGADGVVIGILKPDGTLNMEQMKMLMEDAGDMSVTLHRAFDVCVDPMKAMEQAKELGIRTILTSGQKNHCLEGRDMLKKLVEQEEGRITIQVGSGVDADTIREIQPYTRAHAFHMSGKQNLESRMVYRKEGVSMGVSSISEFEIIRTEEERIRQACQVLESL
ncbi:copper homeostasis protein CutC [Ruminococcus sp. 5_1_39BFAA]|uniref:copper homeostasis protein CutC n=1 Tax=Ruminococcus sp. 5_1_39BFAA TaxID=457412 RepID=UPI0035650F49